MKKILFITALCCVLISCNNSNKKGLSNADYDELLKQEEENAKRAKIGNGETVIEIISNKAEVEKLRSKILEKIKAKRTTEANQEQSCVVKYKAGDKSVVPEMIRILKGGNGDAKLEIYNGLTDGCYERTNCTIQEKDLIATILANIDRPADEEKAIQVAGYLKLDGYVKKFETHLFSGKAKDVGRLVYWIGEDGTSLRTFNYLKEQILGKKINLVTDDWIMSGIEGFAKSKDPLIRQNACNLCFEIYQKKIIPEGNFEEMKDGYSSKNPANSLIEIIYNSNDKRTIAVASEMLRRRIDAYNAINALIRFEGHKHKDQIIEYLEQKDKFMDGLGLASTYYKATKDGSIVTECFIQFEKNGTHQEYEIYKLVTAIMEMGATSYFDKLDGIIKDKQLIASIKNAYELSKGNAQTVASDLYKMGVVGKAFEKSIIDKSMHKDSNSGPIEYVYEFLNNSDIYYFFDAETGMLPVAYDELIIDLAKHSGGQFPEFVVWMDAEDTGDEKKKKNDSEIGEGSLIKYKITLIANDKAYIVKPEDIGDWYDVNVVIDLMTAVLKDANIKGRYNVIETGDQTVQLLFGEPDRVKIFLDKYKL